MRGTPVICYLPTSTGDSIRAKGNSGDMVIMITIGTIDATKHLILFTPFKEGVTNENMSLRY